MQRYNIFQAIVMSFYSKDLYRDVAHNWGGKTFLYLLLVVALSWIPVTFQIQVGLNSAYQRNSDEIVNQVPLLKIEEGKLVTPENRPYFIQDPESKENIAVIDTSGQYKTLEEAKTSVLITQTEIISQSRENETKINKIPDNMNLTINAQVVNEYVKKYLGFAWILLFCVFVIGAYIYRVIQALIYAVLGKFMASMSGSILTYDKILQIAMVAVTPAIILSVIFDFWGIVFPFQLFFYFLLSMAFLLYGIIANKKVITTDSSI